MTSSDLYDEDDAARYDADHADMATPRALTPVLDVLAGLAGDGPALELGIGTGRVAVPLSQRGVSVAGVDLSAPMVERLREKVSAERLPVVVGDMANATAPAAGTYALVYLVFNTLSNLRTQAEQVACFRNAAAHLRPGGAFVVELWVPQLHRATPGLGIAPMSFDDGYLVVDEYDVATQGCVSHHYRPTTGGQVRYGVGRSRYAWPAECDLMAQLAGLERVARWADWSRSPFVSASPCHVSVWRKPAGVASPGDGGR